MCDFWHIRDVKQKGMPMDYRPQNRTVSFISTHLKYMSKNEHIKNGFMLDRIFCTLRHQFTFTLDSNISNPLFLLLL